MPLTGAGNWPETNPDDPGDPGDPQMRPIEELVTSGLLWAINEEMFWPYKAALALHVKDGKVCGWSLQPSPDGTRIDISAELKNDRWKRYQQTLNEFLGWEPGW